MWPSSAEPEGAKGAVLIDRLPLWKLRNRGQPYSLMPGADLLFVNPDYLSGGQVAWGQFKMQYSEKILGGLREAQTKGAFRRKNQIQAAARALNQSQVFTAEQLAFADALAEIG